MEIKERTDVVGTFPNEAEVILLVGALLSELPDKWQVRRRYVGERSIAELKPVDKVTLELGAPEHWMMGS